VFSIRILKSFPVKGGEAQALLAGQPLPASWMQDEELSIEGQGALDFAAKRRNGVATHGFGLAADINKIAGVDGNGADVELGAQVAHLLRVSGLDRRCAPHARAGGEYLEGIGADLDGAVDRRPASAGGAEVHADPPRAAVEFPIFRHVFETT
jgi:hypothetical protein